ncbi:glycoside hydrolase family 16 protein [Fictibacillus halophilus]|uniref:glycoside hydrolase family 16 protein n=1 Tax=Fictibacillus halophilus TaxID=1610490 RepID=UPI001CFB1AB5|nr:glycoside hydrolase family 16 protein [Fictibacillus halophilus]
MLIVCFLFFTSSSPLDPIRLVNNKSIESQNEIISNVVIKGKTVDKKTKTGHWRLIWSDEFNNESSFDDWNLQDWPSDKNGEWQYYTPENVKIDAGKLVIESKRERFKRRVYTSGALTTENRFEFTYGKIEIRAKLPKGNGIFPAFWLVNSMDGNWLPEIDIMENLGDSPNELYFVVHWQDSTGKRMRDFMHYTSDVMDFSEDFHLYSLIWERDKIIWLIDGQALFETKQFSPSNPLFIYLNTAIGGNWPGPPSTTDQYPKKMLIDYVRVYQKNDGGE